MHTQDPDIPENSFWKRKKDGRFVIVRYLMSFGGDEGDYSYVYWEGLVQLAGTWGCAGKGSPQKEYFLAHYEQIENPTITPLQREQQARLDENVRLNKKRREEAPEAAAKLVEYLRDVCGATAKIEDIDNSYVIIRTSDEEFMIQVNYL